MSGRLRAAWRALPGPLVALLGAVLLLGVAWALVVPPFQAPDEQSHAGYVQSLVEGPGLPGTAGRPLFSSEQLAAQVAVNSDQTAANPLGRPQWSAVAWRAWERRDARLPDAARGDGGGPNPAASNPPLFYLYDTLPYLAASGGEYFGRLTLMRLWAVLWLLGTVTAAWLLAGELLGRDRLLQLVAAGVAGLLPMVTFISAQVGPDGMLYALWSLALWLGVRLLRRGAAPAPAVALLGVTGAAIVTKATSWALLPAALLALGVGLWRARRERERVVRTGAVALAALAAPVLAWAAVAHGSDHAVAAQLSTSGGPGGGGGTNWRELASYLWQFYLPRLPFMTPVNLSGGGYPAYHVWIVQGWGAFGWLEVRFPDAIYKALALLTAGVGIAALARLLVLRRRLDRTVALFLALAAAALLAGLHWTDFHNATTGGGRFVQGRYLFPLIALAGVGVAFALTWLGERRRRVGAGVVLGGLFVAQLCSLGLVLTRFYA
jgi:4-amino-4-deoxy-L-arabinose transferase-like glycosyltransferase